MFKRFRPHPLFIFVFLFLVLSTILIRLSLRLKKILCKYTTPSTYTNTGLDTLAVTLPSIGTRSKIRNKFAAIKCCVRINFLQARLLLWRVFSLSLEIRLHVSANSDAAVVATRNPIYLLVYVIVHIPFALAYLAVSLSPSYSPAHSLTHSYPLHQTLFTIDCKLDISTMYSRYKRRMCYKFYLHAV